MSDIAAGGSRLGPISLDQLIALNDEIVALTRSGIPLERGLVYASDDLPGGLRGVTNGLARRMEQGESLPEALEKLDAGVPPVYRAVVTAGLRSGRLSVALEGLATYARGYVEARQQIGLAVWYPLLVLSLAYVLFVFVLVSVIPTFSDTFDSLRIPSHVVVRALRRAGELAWYWAPIGPVCLALFLLSWFRSGSAYGLQGRRSVGVLAWFPWVNSMLAKFEASSFADLLALLLEHKVPYPDAVRLAGEASGDPALARAGRDVAAAVERGESAESALRGTTALPPLLAWVVATGPRQGDLISALRRMAGRYRSDARFQGEKIRVFIPTILLFVIAFGSTLVYALLVFLPLSSLYFQLSKQYP